MQAVTKAQATERANARRLVKQRTLDEFLNPEQQGVPRTFKPYKCRVQGRAMKRIFSASEEA